MEKHHLESARVEPGTSCSASNTRPRLLEYQGLVERVRRGDHRMVCPPRDDIVRNGGPRFTSRPATKKSNSCEKIQSWADFKFLDSLSFFRPTCCVSVSISRRQNFFFCCCLTDQIKVYFICSTWHPIKDPGFDSTNACKLVKNVLFTRLQMMVRSASGFGMDAWLKIKIKKIYSSYQQKPKQML